MGRTVLPDPLEAPRSSANADELLSQLAGSEIDRLLAEADLERPRNTRAPEGNPAEHPAPPKPPPSEHPPVPGAARVRGEVSFAAPAEVKEGGAGSRAPAEAPTTRGALDDAMASQLDNLFAELDEGGGGAGLVADVAGAPAEVGGGAEAARGATAELAVAAALDRAPAAEPVEAPTVESEARVKASAAAELAKELEEIEARAAAVKIATPDEEQGWEDDAEAAGALPIYLRPLEWINAPLMMFPEAVREALGKVAILTLANALAVLVYVVIFRRMH